MRVIKIICLGLLVSFFTVSCKEASKGTKEGVEKSIKGENLKKIEVGIEGMTCQIGCAKTIESKLSKMEGINSVSVSFEDKLGKIVYDANKISEEEITKKITGIAGGETYSVTSVKEMKSGCCSADLKDCTMKCSKTCTEKDCAKCAAVQAECKTKCATEKQACCKGKIETCEKKCTETCTKKDCENCAKATAECKIKCAAKDKACCSADLKECTMKCETGCTEKDCAKCASVQKECKTKCATEKQSCCVATAETKHKECQTKCAKKDCAKCA